MTSAETRQTASKASLRERISDWMFEKRRDSDRRHEAYEEASRSWRFFCAAISCNYTWSVTGDNLDNHHIIKYPDRYLMRRLFLTMDPEGLRSRIASLIAGQSVGKVSQEDLNRSLSFFMASLGSCVGEHIVPDPPARLTKKFAFASEIEQWITDAAKATGADALVRAYFSGVPYEDLLSAEEQELYEEPVRIIYNSGKVWRE